MMAPSIDAAPAQRLILPCVLGACLFAGLLAMGNRMLADPDTYWQIVIGRWILDTGSFPRTDVFSFTMHGQPWISTQWLAQVCYAAAFSLAGWAGPVVLTAASIAGAFAILAWFVGRRLDPVAALILLMAAMAIASPHFLVRPHALAMPVMVAWVAGLIAAADRGETPSFWLLPLMILWANLHGSFIFGLFLIGAIALDAVLKVETPARVRLLLRWFVFGLMALAASCITPYGFDAILAARNILNLGAALSLITEWRPMDFSRVGAFEICLLLGLGTALLKRLTLPPMRIVLVLGLLHMALAHVRNAAVLALLLPIILAAPLAAQLGKRGDEAGSSFVWLQRIAVSVAAVLMLAMTVYALAGNRYRPAGNVTPAAALAILKQNHAQRVFNDYDFGGYMIAQGMAPFIDGRTELYGEKFVVDHNAAREMRDPAIFFALLERYKIDATLLRRSAPAAQILNQVDGWRKIFIDDYVVVHVRDADARHSVEPEVKPASN
ncbi:hypothetical protein BH10PSE11_BH10PSE11_15460 [soil metagenome]